MQEQSPSRNKKKPINKRGKPAAAKKAPVRGKQQSKTMSKGSMLSNPYQNVPVKSNNAVPTSGFGFSGSVN